jgi:hypothetical protein
MDRLDETKLLKLLEWMSEAEEEHPDDIDASAPRKQKFGDKPQAGHKRINPGDMSGDNPEENPVKSQMSPKLAGERAKAIMVMGRVSGFIDKYSDMAVDKFGGAKATPGGFALGGGVRKAEPTKGAGDRENTKGGVKNFQQMMSKDKVLQLVEKLPMMPGSQMTFAVRAIGNYIWKIHATARDNLRNATKEMLSKQKGYKVKSDEIGYAESLKAASREFDDDSTNVKADLNMLAAVCGVLKRSGGFGGQADKTFLKKVIKGYVDASGGFHLLGVDIKPQESDVTLPPELAAMAAAPEKEEDDEDEPKSSKGSSSKSSSGPAKVAAKGPTVRKMSTVSKADQPSDEEADEFLKGIADAYSRKVDNYMTSIIEVAAANRKPKWWDEL